MLKIKLMVSKQIFLNNESALSFEQFLLNLIFDSCCWCYNFWWLQCFKLTRRIVPGVLSRRNQFFYNRFPDSYFKCCFNPRHIESNGNLVIKNVGTEWRIVLVLLKLFVKSNDFGTILEHFNETLNMFIPLIVTLSIFR